MMIIIMFINTLTRSTRQSWLSSHPTVVFKMAATQRQTSPVSAAAAASQSSSPATFTVIIHHCHRCRRQSVVAIIHHYSHHACPSSTGPVYTSPPGLEKSQALRFVTVSDRARPTLNRTCVHVKSYPQGWNSHRPYGL